MKKIEKYMPDIETAIQSNFNELAPVLEDTGWLPLILETGFSHNNTASPEYRLKNGKVTLRGRMDRVSNKLGVFSSTPVGARTSSDYYQGFSLPQQSSVANTVATVYAKPNGDLELVSAGNDTAVWLDGISFDVN
ncbi:hypothetical protein J8O47_000153 [Listeria monocytogenes]|nr:hypothetical protein [Listeria monocytogenes]